MMPVPRDSRLDGNGDGLVDNIILVMDADTETAESLFWPRAFALPGIGINDVQSGMVNIQNSATLFGSSIMGGVGVLGHEFLHLLHRLQSCRRRRIIESQHIRSSVPSSA